MAACGRVIHAAGATHSWRPRVHTRIAGITRFRTGAGATALHFFRATGVRGAHFTRQRDPLRLARHLHLPPLRNDSAQYAPHLPTADSASGASITARAATKHTTTYLPMFQILALQHLVQVCGANGHVPKVLWPPKHDAKW